MVVASSVLLGESALPPVLPSWVVLTLLPNPQEQMSRASLTRASGPVFPGGLSKLKGLDFRTLE